MVVKCILHMHIIAELKAFWLLVDFFKLPLTSLRTSYEHGSTDLT